MQFIGCGRGRLLLESERQAELVSVALQVAGLDVGGEGEGHAGGKDLGVAQTQVKGLVDLGLDE